MKRVFDADQRLKHMNAIHAFSLSAFIGSYPRNPRNPR
jgi:hypothetical protein